MFSVSPSPGIGVATVPLGQLARLDVGEKSCANSALALANHVELAERLRRQNGLERPEHPCHDRRDIDEEFQSLWNIALSRRYNPLW